MDLRVLQYVCAIADTGSFAKAADKVHISQPALSKAIHGLEDELKERLFERGKRGTSLRLTPSGEVVVKHARNLLAARDSMKFELNQLKKLEQGTLNIGLTPLGSAELFAPLIAHFRQRYPNVAMHLLNRGGAEQEQALKDQQIELAMSLIPSDPSLSWLQIRNDPLMVALPSNSDLAQRPSVHLSDFSKTPLIEFDDTFMLNKAIHDAFSAEGISFQTAAQVTQVGFGLALVASGTGAMLIPEIIAERMQTPGVVFIPLKSSTLRWQLSVIWRKDAALSQAARTFLDEIQKHFELPLF